VPGYETARWLGAKAIFVEREAGVFKLRRGFAIEPGARVLMVEDIITTGLSSRECLAAIAEHPGVIVGAACLIDRSAARRISGSGGWRSLLSTFRLCARCVAARACRHAGVKPGSRASIGAV